VQRFDQDEEFHLVDQPGLARPGAPYIERHECICLLSILHTGRVPYRLQTTDVKELLKFMSTALHGDISVFLLQDVSPFISQLLAHPQYRRVKVVRDASLLSHDLLSCSPTPAFHLGPFSGENLQTL
jgi:hypothetical protein